jgi:hypothetical protein
MPRSRRRSDDDPSVDDTKVSRVLRAAAVAMVLFDYSSTQAILKLSDAELGRWFKRNLAQVIGMSIVLDLDLNSNGKQNDSRRKDAEGGMNRRMSTRAALISHGRLLRAPIVSDALGITEQRLAKNVAASQIFSVNVGRDEFYPAFFLARELDRRKLATVVRRLDGLNGWAKWKFFTEPKASLTNLTPLQALLHGEMKPVLQTADAFVASSKKLAKGKVSGTRSS